MVKGPVAKLYDATSWPRRAEGLFHKIPVPVANPQTPARTSWTEATVIDRYSPIGRQEAVFKFWRSLVRHRRQETNFQINSASPKGTAPLRNPAGFAMGVIGFHAAFSIWPKPRRYAESTKPCWHLTPASIRKPICSSFERIFSQKAPSRESIRTAIAALVPRKGDILASEASIARSEF
jgi:hypothetical protein